MQRGCWETAPKEVLDSPAVAPISWGQSGEAKDSHTIND